ncbi:MAG: mannitol dehydrogenase family protein [Vitreoscilla sp.]
MPAGQPILQFGTSRFLQAHVDLLVSEAMTKGEALGGITVVQTTDDPRSAARVAALASGRGHQVRIRGLSHGQAVDERRHCDSVRAALRTSTDWAAVRGEFAGDTLQVVVSNTGDAGWRLDDADGVQALAPGAPPPRAFPAKLLVALHDRWRARPEAALTLLPCELVARNGDRLREIVVGLAQDWQLDEAFQDWLHERPVWANSLVDRIVPEAIEPVGAIAEPYALWAIERQPGLVAPCRHADIVLTDDLGPFERLKLWLLNLGHTALAELWLRDGQPSGRTVVQAMNDAATRRTLESLWADEVLPVFDALGEGDAARAYLDTLRDRLLNPWLAHRLADIAGNHEQKKARRLAPVVAAAQQCAPALPQPWLRGALAPAAGLDAKESLQ